MPSNNARADADQCRPFLDRDLEVVGHAHRQMFDVAAGSAAACKRSRSWRKFGERRAGRPRDRRSEPPLSSGRGRGRAAAPSAATRARGRFVRREAVLFGSPADVDFQQHVERPALDRGFALDRVEQTDAVDGMNQVDPAERPFDLVPLQVADEVPADGRRQRLGLVPQACGRLSPRSRTPSSVRMVAAVGPTELGDGDQRDLRPLADRPGASGPNAVLQPGEPVGEERAQWRPSTLLVLSSADATAGSVEYRFRSVYTAPQD